jgi:hypothetical protein
MFSTAPCHLIWLLLIPIPQNFENFSTFYGNGPYVTGITYWRFLCLFSSNQWLQQIWILMSLFICDFKNISPGISPRYSFYGHPLTSLINKITYIWQCCVRNIVKYGSFIADFVSPCLSWHQTVTESLYLACHHPTVLTSTCFMCSN